MKNEICLVPEKCGKCGELFDLKYDVEVLQRKLGEEEALEKVVCELKSKNGNLCWECRNL